MSYEVLARKWRPRYFDEVVGQEHVARTLRNSIEQDRVHHAYLFCGARGVGKTSTARILAKSLNCDEGPTVRPCYDCKSCEDITEGQSVDVYEIDGASNRGINEIRELREGVRYAPSQGRYKIYIIDEVHMLTTEAFNALLKTLEEPPDHAYFIFATTEPQKIPVTILSRCQRFDFKRISQRDIVEHLESLCEQEEIEVESEALQLIARQADGAMRDALSLLDQVIGFAGDTVTEDQVAGILGVANREHLFAISDAILRRDPGAALEALDTVDRYGYDMQQFASELVTHLRDLMVTEAVDDPAAVTGLTESELEEARNQLDSMNVRDPDARRQLIHRFFSVTADGAREMTRSPYPKLIFEKTLIRLTQLEPLVDLDLLVDRLSMLESEFEGDEPLPELTGTRLDPVAGSKQSVDAEPEAGAGAASESSSSSPSNPSSEATSSPTPPDSNQPSLADVDPGGSGDQATNAAQSSAQRSASSQDRSSDTGSSGAGETVEATETTDSASDGEDAEDDEDPEPAGGTVPASPGPPSGGPPPGEPPPGETPPPTDPSPAPESEDPPTRTATGETDESESGDVAELVENFDSLSVEQRWAGLVRQLRRDFGSSGVRYERFYPETFEHGELHLLGRPKFVDIFDVPEEQQRLKAALERHVGGDWSVEIEAVDRDADDQEAFDDKTLAAQREAEWEQRRQDLRDHIREHPAVEEAENLFGISDEQIYIEVDLDDRE